MNSSVSEGVTLILFHGGVSHSWVERAMACVRLAIAEETVRKAMGCESVSAVVVCTEDEDFEIPVSAPKPVFIETTPSGHHFHFGRELTRVITERKIGNPFYMGGACGPLMTATEMEDVAQQLMQNERAAVTNNVHSSDFVAFRPGSAIECIDPPAIDNSLTYLLRDGAGLRALQAQETVGTCFDVDTPTDALILGSHPRAAEAIREAVRAMGVEGPRLHDANDVLMTAFSDVLLWGRVGPSLLTYLNQYTRCRWRVVSEERGMKALGRMDRGEVVSVLGLLLQEVGVKRFFEHLSGLSRLAIIDSRVLFAHMGIRPTAEDRFLSDLGMWSEVTDPFVRDFTKGAAEADIPVILGGHSLVSGGLRALVDALWCRWLDSRTPIEVPSPS